MNFSSLKLIPLFIFCFFIQIAIANNNSMLRSEFQVIKSNKATTYILRNGTNIHIAKDAINYSLKDSPYSMVLVHFNRINNLRPVLFAAPPSSDGTLSMPKPKTIVSSPVVVMDDRIIWFDENFKQQIKTSQKIKKASLHYSTATNITTYVFEKQNSADILIMDSSNNSIYIKDVTRDTIRPIRVTNWFNVTKDNQILLKKENSYLAVDLNNFLQDSEKFKRSGTDSLLANFNTPLKAIEDKQLASKVKLTEEENKLLKEVSNFISEINLDEINLEKDFESSKEIIEIRKIISNKKTSSIVITGPSGSGKTHKVKSIIKAITQNKIPEYGEKQPYILKLNPNAMIAGTNLRGDLEKKVTKLVELAKSKKFLFYIENLSSLKSGTSESSDDLLTMLTPYIAEGNFKIIGTDSDERYFSVIGSNTELSDRIVEIQHKSPSKEKTIEILKKIAKEKDFTINEKQLNHIYSQADKYSVNSNNPQKSVKLLGQVISDVRFDQKVNNKVEKLNIKKISKIAASLYNVPKIFIDDKVRIEKLHGFKEYLDANMIGNENIKKRLIKISAQSLLGLSEKNLPFGIYLLSGDSGKGKTYAAKLYSEYLGLSPKLNLIEMATYKTPYQIELFKSKIVNYLTKNPFAVLLFDEVEKAHPEIQEALLNFLNEGTITADIGKEGQIVQRTISGKNSHVLMTTNAGLKYINSLESPEDYSEIKHRLVLEEDGIPRAFIDRILHIDPVFDLTSEEVKQLIEFRLNQYIEFAKIQFENELHIKLKINESMKKKFITKYHSSMLSEVSSKGPIGFSQEEVEEVVLERVKKSAREIERHLKDLVFTKASEKYIERPSCKSLTISLLD